MTGDLAIDVGMFLFYTGVMLFVGYVVGGFREWDRAYKRGAADEAARWQRSYDAAPHCKAVPLTPREAIR